MKRLALDLRLFEYARTGFFRYGQGLLQMLAARPAATEIVLVRGPQQDLGALNRAGWEEVVTDAPLFDDREAAGLRRTVDAHRLDAVHFPSSLLPGRVAQRVIVTVHDLTVLEHPETIEARYRPWYRDTLDRLPEADAVLVDSAALARDIAALHRGSHTPHVVEPATPQEGHGTGRLQPATRASLPRGPYVLSVGSLEPRKDPLRLLRAWETARQHRNAALPLVLVAAHGWLEDEFHAAVRASRWAEEIDLRRDVDDTELVALMRGCALFLWTPRYEGFGLPVLEAAEAGACVLSTPVPSLVEAGAPEGIFIGADEADTLVGARIHALVEDVPRRERLAETLRSRLRAHYRNVASDRLARAYESVLGSAVPS